MPCRGIWGLGRVDGGQLEVNDPLPDYKPYCMWVQSTVNRSFMSLFRSGLCFSKVSLLLLIYYTRGTDVLPYCIITLCFLPLKTVWVKWLYFVGKTVCHVNVKAKWNNWGRASVALVYGQWWQAGLLRSVLQVNMLQWKELCSSRVQRERWISMNERKYYLLIVTIDCSNLNAKFGVTTCTVCVCVKDISIFLLAANAFIMTVFCRHWQYATGLTGNHQQG